MNQRACDGGNAIACGNVGFHKEFGLKTPQDLKKAKQYFSRACALKKGTCLRLGILRESYPQTIKGSAKRAYVTACKEGKSRFASLSCAYLNRFYKGKYRYSKKQLAGLKKSMLPQCKQNVARACGFIGVVLLLENQNSAMNTLQKACSLGDTWACILKLKAQ